jgi:hypothetical protein
MMLLGLATCSGAAANDCLCTITIGTETQSLMCGDSGCISGQAYGCDVDGPVPLGSCGLPDGFGDGFDLAGVDLLLPYSPCIPSESVCQPLTTDAGTIEPTCDPTTRRCCVPTGSFCTQSFDCCEGHVCVDTLTSEEGDGGAATPRHCGN